MEFDSLSGYTVPAYTPAEQKAIEPKVQAPAETAAAQAIPIKAIPTNEQKNIDDANLSVEEFANQSRERNDPSSVPDMMAKAIEQANKKLVGTSREFSFAVHERTKMVMIKVIDSSTKETVREIPPQKALDALAKMWELAGILVDEKR